MNVHPLSSRLAVGSRSLQPSNPQELIAAIQATGVGRSQLASGDLCVERQAGLQAVADTAARVMVEGVEA